MIWASFSMKIYQCQSIDLQYIFNYYHYFSMSYFYINLSCFLQFLSIFQFPFVFFLLLHFRLYLNIHLQTIFSYGVLIFFVIMLLWAAMIHRLHLKMRMRTMPLFWTSFHLFSFLIKSHCFYFGSILMWNLGHQFRCCYLIFFLLKFYLKILYYFLSF